jgi:iron complex outermembrane receptor protein
MSDYSLNQSGPVATYYDEVYKGNFAFLGVALYDLERVEVLRGPQGTLYGKNTTGGAVNLISRKPEIGKTEGYVNLGYGNYNRMELNGALNVPLGDTLAARVAVTVARANGWFKNQLPGQPDLAGVREYARARIVAVRAVGQRPLRPACRDQLSESAQLRHYTRSPEALYQPARAQPPPDRGQRTDRRHARTYSVALTSTFDIGDALAITSVTSWDKGSLSFYEDTDGTATELLEIPYTDRATQFAQDLRLTSDFAGPFNFILGAYFNREKVYNETTFEIGKDIDIRWPARITDQDCAIGLPLGCLFRNSFDQLKKSYAVYSDLSIRNHRRAEAARRPALYQRQRIADQFRVQRARSQRRARGQPDPAIVAALQHQQPLGEDRFRLQDRSRRASLRQLQPWLSRAELQRAGILRPVGAVDRQGGKDRRVRAGRQDPVRRPPDHAERGRVPLQLQQPAIHQYRPGDRRTDSAQYRESRIYGGEAELTARASDMLTLRAGIGILDAKIKRGIVSGVDVRGNKLSNAPSFTFAGGVDAIVVDGRRAANSACMAI